MVDRAGIVRKYPVDGPQIKKIIDGCKKQDCSKNDKLQACPGRLFVGTNYIDEILYIRP